MALLNKKEWIKCSAVAVGFYLAVYILLAHYFWGYTHIWLILGCIAFAITDVLGLHWWFRKQEEEDGNDRYYP